MGVKITKPRGINGLAGWALVENGPNLFLRLLGSVQLPARALQWTSQLLNPIADQWVRREELSWSQLTNWLN
jgi:hypothetical protein